MENEYRNRHPIAWTVIAGIALFSAVAFGAIKGWLPIADSGIAQQVCNECAVVESVRTVEAPMAPLDLAPADAASAADGSAVAPDATAAAPELIDQVVYSYEITVRFDNGSTTVVSQAEPPTWQAGDKVKVVDGMILASG